ncbi:MAG: VTT domain-containing protein [Clostridiaceae bacterium]|nr:VTT domain-containing protein [Clostridiaceae bacterium]
MEYVIYLTEIVIRLNYMIEKIVVHGGNWAYAVMFLILYAGAAFVLAAPFLPSVSLIFLVTSLSITGLINPVTALLTLTAAIVLGDVTSYYIGKIIRDKIITTNRLSIIKESHIERTKALYDEVGLTAVIFARFTPIIGSLAQMVAGAINYSMDAFISRNVIAGIIWLLVNFALGWAFAVIPELRGNFIVLIMIMPAFSFLVSMLYYLKKSIASSKTTR